MTRPPRILFLPDCGPRIGGGHVMRCLTLAGALMARGAHCAFAASPSAEAVIETYGAPGIEALFAPEGDLSALVRQTQQLAETHEPDWLVIDHYGLSDAEEMLLRAPQRRLMAIDDLGRAHDCDLLLDPGYGRTEADYRDKVPDWTVLLTGPAYALVRSAFAQTRHGALARRLDEAAARVLVSLGLTDVEAITARVVRALEPSLGAMQMDVTLGHGAPSLAALKALADPRLHLHLDAHDMAALMAEADLAVGAGGSSAWERACLGLPAVTVILADNQRDLARRMDADGVTLAVEAAGPDFEAELASAFARLAGDGALRRGMAGRLSVLCDGRGAERVAEAMLG